MEEQAVSSNTLSHAGDYARIEQAIAYIAAHYREQPDLEQIAAHVHLSKYHFDRLFRRWAGVSPKRFLGYLALDHAKGKLARGSVLDAALDAGLSGAGRLHDLFVTMEAMSPGEYKSGGAGLDISYGFHPTPFGECLLAATRRGICHLGFVAGEGRQGALGAVKKMLPAARMHEDSAGTTEMVERIFTPEGAPGRPFHLHLRGTNFQINVWRALLRIPEGSLVSYGDVATHLGRPAAFRAVAGALAVNPVGYLIPCHRVIARTGAMQGFRWGIARKQAMQGWEAARTEDVEA